MAARIISAIAGIWLMAAPGILDFDKAASDNGHIIGPLIACFAIISLSPCTNAVRKFNMPLGAWLLLAPWVLGYGSHLAIFNDLFAGLAVILLSLVRSSSGKRFGGGWSGIWKAGSLHEREAEKIKLGH